jgi:hypothetical protein
MTNHKIDLLIVEAEEKLSIEKQAEEKEVKRQEDETRRLLIESLGEHAEYFVNRDKEEHFDNPAYMWWIFPLDHENELAEISIYFRIMQNQENMPVFKLNDPQVKIGSYSIENIDKMFLAARNLYPTQRQNKKNKDSNTAKSVFFNYAKNKDESEAQRALAYLQTEYPESETTWLEMFNAWDLDRRVYNASPARRCIRYYSDSNGTTDPDIAKESFENLCSRIPEKTDLWKADYEAWNEQHESALEAIREAKQAEAEYKDKLENFLDDYAHWKTQVDQIRKENEKGIDEIRDLESKPFPCYIVIFALTPAQLAAGVETDLIYTWEDHPNKYGYWLTTDDRYIKIENVVTIESVARTRKDNIPGTITVTKAGRTFRFMPGTDIKWAEDFVTERIKNEPAFPDYDGITWKDIEKYEIEIPDSEY